MHEDRGARRAGMRDAAALRTLWDGFAGDAAGAAQVRAVLAHPGTSAWLAPAEGAPAAALVLHVLPNATRGGRPYGLIENVITAAAHRRRGHARAALAAALEHARAEGAYKVMLLTGGDAGVRRFYARCGFAEGEKTAMQVRF